MFQITQPSNSAAVSPQFSLPSKPVAPLQELVEAGILTEKGHITERFKDFSFPFEVDARCTIKLPAGERREIIGSGVFRYLGKEFLEKAIEALEKRSGCSLPALREALKNWKAPKGRDLDFRCFGVPGTPEAWAEQIKGEVVKGKEQTFARYNSLKYDITIYEKPLERDHLWYSDALQLVVEPDSSLKIHSDHLALFVICNLHHWVHTDDPDGITNAFHRVVDRTARGWRLLDPTIPGILFSKMVYSIPSKERWQPGGQIETLMCHTAKGHCDDGAWGMLDYLIRYAQTACSSNWVEDEHPLIWQMVERLQSRYLPKGIIQELNKEKMDRAWHTLQNVRFQADMLTPAVIQLYMDRISRGLSCHLNDVPLSSAHQLMNELAKKAKHRIAASTWKVWVHALKDEPWMTEHLRSVYAHNPTLVMALDEADRAYWTVCHLYSQETNGKKRADWVEKHSLGNDPWMRPQIFNDPEALEHLTDTLEPRTILEQIALWGVHQNEGEFKALFKKVAKDPEALRALETRAKTTFLPNHHKWADLLAIAKLGFIEDLTERAERYLQADLDPKSSDNRAIALKLLSQPLPAALKGQIWLYAEKIGAQPSQDLLTPPFLQAVIDDEGWDSLCALLQRVEEQKEYRDIALQALIHAPKLKQMYAWNLQASDALIPCWKALIQDSQNPEPLYRKWKEARGGLCEAVASCALKRLSCMRAKAKVARELLDFYIKRRAWEAAWPLADQYGNASQLKKLLRSPYRNQALLKLVAKGGKLPSCNGLDPQWIAEHLVPARKWKPAERLMLIRALAFHPIAGKSLRPLLDSATIQQLTPEERSRVLDRAWQWTPASTLKRYAHPKQWIKLTRELLNTQVTTLSSEDVEPVLEALLTELPNAKQLPKVVHDAIFRYAIEKNSLDVGPLASLIPLLERFADVEMRAAFLQRFKPGPIALKQIETFLASVDEEKDTPGVACFHLLDLIPEKHMGSDTASKLIHFLTGGVCHEKKPIGMIASTIYQWLAKRAERGCELEEDSGTLMRWVCPAPLGEVQKLDELLASEQWTQRKYWALLRLRLRRRLWIDTEEKAQLAHALLKICTSHLSIDDAGSAYLVTSFCQVYKLSLSADVLHDYWRWSGGEPWHLSAKFLLEGLQACLDDRMDLLDASLGYAEQLIDRAPADEKQSTEYVELWGCYLRGLITQEEEPKPSSLERLDPPSKPCALILQFAKGQPFAAELSLKPAVASALIAWAASLLTPRKGVSDERKCEIVSRVLDFIESVLRVNSRWKSDQLKKLDLAIDRLLFMVGTLSKRQGSACWKFLDRMIAMPWPKEHRQIENLMFRECVATYRPLYLFFLVRLTENKERGPIHMKAFKMGVAKFQSPLITKIFWGWSEGHKNKWKIRHEFFSLFTNGQAELPDIEGDEFLGWIFEILNRYPCDVTFVQAYLSLVLTAESEVEEKLKRIEPFINKQSRGMFAWVGGQPLKAVLAGKSGEEAFSMFGVFVSQIARNHTPINLSTAIRLIERIALFIPLCKGPSHKPMVSQILCPMVQYIDRILRLFPDKRDELIPVMDTIDPYLQEYSKRSNVDPQLRADPDFPQMCKIENLSFLLCWAHKQKRPTARDFLMDCMCRALRGVENPATQEVLLISALAGATLETKKELIALYGEKLRPWMTTLGMRSVGLDSNVS